MRSHTGSALLTLVVTALSRYDHQLRPTPKEAMSHPFFRPVVEYKAEQEKKQRAAEAARAEGATAAGAAGAGSRAGSGTGAGGPA